jgi:general secretion pathway protein I
MAILRTEHCRKQHALRSVSGLTLIEVLIALAIIAIAMTAIIKAASQNIRSTTYLQTKSIAMWTAQQTMNEVRSGVLTIPMGDHTLKQTIKMLDQTFYVEVTQAETPNKHISKIDVDVYANENHEEDAAPLITLESYLYRATHD